MVRPERFELPTLWFVAKCSIQLSYGRNRKRLAEIRLYRKHPDDEIVDAQLLGIQ
jgi:hypothetical protein